MDQLLGLNKTSIYDFGPIKIILSILKLLEKTLIPLGFT